MRWMVAVAPPNPCTPLPAMPVTAYPPFSRAMVAVPENSEVFVQSSVVAESECHCHVPERSAMGVPCCDTATVASLPSAERTVTVPLRTPLPLHGAAVTSSAVPVTAAESHVVLPVSVAAVSSVPPAVIPQVRRPPSGPNESCAGSTAIPVSPAACCVTSSTAKAPSALVTVTSPRRSPPSLTVAVTRSCFSTISAESHSAWSDVTKAAGTLPCVTTETVLVSPSPEEAKVSEAGSSVIP